MLILDPYDMTFDAVGVFGLVWSGLVRSALVKLALFEQSNL